MSFDPFHDEDPELPLFGLGLQGALCAALMAFVIWSGTVIGLGLGVIGP